ncbi:MAG: hypothetical protein QM820_46805 [Minicystis sp.]
MVDGELPAGESGAAERRFLSAVGGFGLLAGLVLAGRPALIAASALRGATPLALLATRELGLALAAVGALALSVGRSGPRLLRIRAIAIFGVLAAALGVNHLVRVSTEAEPLFAPAHSYGEAAALIVLAATAFAIAARGRRDLNAS